jgi:hypothetical protein
MVGCHCSMCRKHHGAAYATFASAAIEGFHWLGDEDTIRSYDSSAQGRRSFCQICGSVTPMLLPS